MPIHNLGYRKWEGERESGSSRWSVVAGIGIRRAWQSTWVRRIVFVVWGPPLAYAALIFGFEQFLSDQWKLNPRAATTAVSFALPLESLPGVEEALRDLENASDDEKLAQTRPIVWKAVMLQLQHSQCIGMVFVVGLIAPALISQDVRSRAFLLYFSRPLTRVQYIGGKFATIAGYLLATTTLPQLLLYVFAVLLSPDISVVAHTWDIPLRTIVASVVMITPITLLALMISSLTIETRFATFGWFSLWIFGLTAYVVMQRVSGDTSDLILHLSFLYLLFSDLSTGIMGIPLHNNYFDTQIAFVIALSAISFAVVHHRVSAPLRA